MSAKGGWFQQLAREKNRCGAELSCQIELSNKLAAGVKFGLRAKNFQLNVYSLAGRHAGAVGISTHQTAGNVAVSDEK